MSERRFVIVGGGPAGLSAAAALIAHGQRPVVVDEAPRPGGQAYRSPAPGVELDVARLYGSQHDKYVHIHETAAQVRGGADYRPRHLAWAAHANVLHIQGPDGVDAVPYDVLVLATGATDRTAPVKGWTLPGVFTLGASQVLLKDQGCAVGRHVLFCGSSPLLYLAALQYVQAGASVAAVLDTTPFPDKIAALPAMLASPGTLMRGLGYMRELRRAGVRIEHGVRVTELHGDGNGVEGVSFRGRAGASETIACDAVALGFGLRPETQLAELAGCRFRHDPVFRQWLPETDADGRAGSGLYLAGDGQAIGGADAAEASGRLAALAALDDLRIATPAGERARLRRRVARLRRFQKGMARAFAWPASWPGEADDATLVCRCENVSAGQLRAALGARFGPREINRLKALTRCGMGRCQGRFCEHAALELAAHALSLPLAEIGRLRTQPPVKPLPFAAAVGSLEDGP